MWFENATVMMFENASVLVSHYGYLAIFWFLAGGMVGLPLPEETVMVFIGYLVYAGRLEYVPTLISAIIGSLTGVTISFLIGRNIGIPIIDRFGNRIGLTQKRIDQVEKWFNRFGKFALPIGYFVPGVRHFMAYFAGISHLPYRTFALYAYIGGIFWVVLFVSLGRFLGEGWFRVSRSIQHYWLPIILVLFSVAGLGYVVYRRNQSQPDGLLKREE
jgi:membrane protein DedA with SNARE-associated domain